MPSHPIRIGIDCRLSGPAHAGIGRYIENLVTRLPFDDRQFEWVFFFHDQHQVPEDVGLRQSLNDRQSSRVRIVHAPIKHYSLVEQLQLPTIFHQAKLDLLHVPHFNVPIRLASSPKLIITIHDLLWHEQRGASVTTLPSWKYWFKYFGYRYVTTQAINRAKHILVPSQTVQETVTRFYPDAADKITVTYEGVAPSIKPTKTSSARQPSKTLLYVGSLYPHKNISLVLRSLSEMPDFTLKIVGSRNVFQQAVRQEVQQLGVEDQVEFLGQVSDIEVAKLYHSSWALVQPSLSEGFGLTGLEAMASGGAVLASDIPVFREIYQDGALYFDPHSTVSFIKAVTSLKPATRQDLLAQATKVAGQYSWQKMVDQTVAVYRQVASTL